MFATSKKNGFPKLVLILLAKYVYHIIIFNMYGLSSVKHTLLTSRERILFIAALFYWDKLFSYSTSEQ